MRKRTVTILAASGLLLVSGLFSLTRSEAEDETNLVPMRVKDLAVDPSDQPIVLLEEIDGVRFLPIWINDTAAQAIAIEMNHITMPRPMTHDLIKNIVSGLGGKVTKIVINDLRDRTFYALIYLEQNGSEVTIDSRPSDAIALALRVKSLIFTVDEVMDKAGRSPEPEGGEERRDIPSRIGGEDETQEI